MADPGFALGVSFDIKTNPLPSNAFSRCLPPHRTAALHVQSRRKTSSPTSCVKSASTLAEAIHITQRSVYKFTHMFFVFGPSFSFSPARLLWGARGQIIVCKSIWKRRLKLKWLAPAAGQFLSKPCPTACMPKVAWAPVPQFVPTSGGAPASVHAL